MTLNKQALRQEIHKYYQNTPENVHGVSYGYKYVAGQRTNELALIFEVAEKKPRDELSSAELLPGFVVIDGQRVPTDVQAVQYKLLSACYNARDTFQPSHEIMRLRGVPNALVPMRGGQEIDMFPDKFSAYGGGPKGTLGFFAIDNLDNRIVGVTNTHVVLPNVYYAGDEQRHFLGYGNYAGLGEPPPVTWLQATYPEVYDPINIIEPRFWTPDGRRYPMGCLIPDAAVGDSFHHAGLHIKRYVPYISDELNYADAALLIMNNDRHLPSNQYFVDENSSRIWTPDDIAGETHYPFATTEEIDGLLDDPENPPRVYSTGRTTGPKGYCETFTDSQLILTAITGDVDLEGGVIFSDAITYTTKNPNNLAFAAVLGGDSGSALLADIDTGPGGVVRKIIGLVFAGQNGRDGAPDGLSARACRIDRVAEILKIRAWTADYTFNRATSLSIPTPVLVTKEIDSHGLALTYQPTEGSNELYWHAGLTSRRDISSNAPTDIITDPPAPFVLPDNVVGGHVICRLEAVDFDALDTFVYTLVDNADNAWFDITGDTLRVNLAAGDFFDATVKDTYTIKVRATDSANASVTKEFTITLLPAPKYPPEDITLTNNTLVENVALADATVGVLAAVDDDGLNDTYAFDLVDTGPDPAAYADNALFVILGATLKIGASNLLNSSSPYSIRIRVTDSIGNEFTKNFTITVTPTPTAPTFNFVTASTSSAALDLYGGANALLGEFVLSSPEPSGGVTYTLVAGAEDDYNALVQISGAELRSINNLTFADFDPTLQATSVLVNIRVRCTDNDTGLYSEITLSAFSVYPPAAPASLTLTLEPAASFMYQGAGQIVGTLSALNGSDFTALLDDNVEYALVAYSPNIIESADNNLFEIARRDNAGTAGPWVLKTSSNLTWPVDNGGYFFITIQVTDTTTGMSLTQPIYPYFSVDAPAPLSTVYLYFSPNSVYTATSATLSGGTTGLDLASVLDGTGYVVDSSPYGVIAYDLESATLDVNGDSINLFEIVGNTLRLKAGASISGAEFELKYYTLTIRIYNTNPNAVGESRSGYEQDVTVDAQFGITFSY